MVYMLRRLYRLLRFNTLRSIHLKTANISFTDNRRKDVKKRQTNVLWVRNIKLLGVGLLVEFAIAQM